MDAGGEGERAALVCLLVAIEQLRQQLDAVSSGRTPFTGAVVAPGFFYLKDDPEPALGV